MQKLTVYDLWPGLPPIQRGALCATGLMAGFQVHFAWSDGSFYLDAGELVGERTFFLRLYHILHRDSFQPQADEKWLDILYKLYGQLGACNAAEAEKSLSREAFGARLEKIRRLTLSLPVEEDPFLLRFQAVYGQWAGFQLCGERPVNPVNRGEAGVYKEIFEKSADGVESIDHAIQTLLHVLPGDAHRILDVGSGPGYVNRCLPPDRAVLAMDIDPDILKENRCQTCVGDILNIPLAENTVDLCMACDVLEHIEPEKLPRAVAELCRVSGRYLYLQVPYREQLPASWARCPQCGHIWHVNFHKNSFSLRQILALPDEGWEPVAVGFTGEISYQGDELQENRLLESQGLSSCRVEGWSCPVCGAQSESYLYEPFQHLHVACSASPQEEAAPRYSEIAVLFCKKDMVPPKRVRRLLTCLDTKKEVGKERTSLLRFRPDMLISSVYTGSELLPFALCGNSCFDWEKDGQILKKDKEQPAFVSVAFPLRPSSGDVLRIRGNTERENRLTVCMPDAAGQEALLGNILLEPGIFDEELSIDYRFSASRAFVKIYFEQESIVFHSVALSDNSGSAYQLYQAGKGDHLARFQDGIACFWYVAPEEPVRILPQLSQWPAAAEKDRVPSPALLPDYIGSLRGIIGEQCREYERSSAEQAEVIADLSGRVDEKEAAIFLLESVRCRLQLQVEEQAAALELAEQRVAVLQLELIQAKEKLALYSVASVVRPKKRLALRAGAAKVLRKFCKFSIRVMHKIPYLYPLLVRLGVKKTYNRLKLIIKSGESYE